MGLNIKSTEAKKINIKDLNGQVTEVTSVYARLEFASRIDGKSMEVAFPYFTLSKEAFDLQAPFVQCDVPNSTSGEVLLQNVTTAHELCKAYLDSLGYECEIVL